jgi:hypothetical protein
MAKPTLLVLAAGMGSRYGGLKQMDPMGPHGETILDYSVFDAIRAGFGKVVFIIREDFADAFRESIGARFAGQIEIDYAFQKLDDLPEGFRVPEGRTKPWGTAHAVRAARHVTQEPFAVINADDFYGRDAYVRAVEYLTQIQSDTTPSSCCLIGYYLNKTLSQHGGVNRGITSSKGGNLTDVEEIIGIVRSDKGVITGETVSGESREIEKDVIVSMNFWGFTPDHFDELEREFTKFLEAHGTEAKSECFIPTVVDGLIADGVTRCEVLATTSSWFGVTYPDDKPRVMDSILKLIKKGEYPKQLIILPGSSR